MTAVDQTLVEAHGQGRVSVWTTSFGEEATQIASTLALEEEDLIFAQYRESGVVIARGLPIENIMNQATSNKDDLGKGRQSPTHIGSSDTHFVTISSPLATQLPQAVGVAYTYKRCFNII